MHLWRITNILKSKQEIGKIGEDIACSYLEKNNYKIICRNYRTKTGEIDIIARDITKEIVFIEVKTRQNLKYGYPIDAINKQKLIHICKTATLYILLNKLENNNIRFDAIEVYISNKKAKIRHVKNIVI